MPAETTASAVEQSLVGRRFASGEPYLVSREKVAEFARATGGDPRQDTPPVTFPIVVAFAAMQAMFDDPSTGIALHRVVHGDQRFTYERPLRVGDRVSAELEVVSLRQIGGADIVGTSTTLRDERGEPLCTATATFVHSAGEGER